MGSDSLVKRPIQNLDLGELQLKMSEFLTGITGKSYSVEVLRINFEPKNNDFFKDRAEITLRLETAGWVFYSKKEKKVGNSDQGDRHESQPEPRRQQKDAYKISLYSTDGVETLVEEIPSYERAVAIRNQMYDERDSNDCSEFLIERC